jgi:hypothetical protein
LSTRRTLAGALVLLVAASGVVALTDTAPRIAARNGVGHYGALDVELKWWDGSPASDVGIEILPRGERQPYQHIQHDRTDAAGRVRTDAIRAGPVTIQVDRASVQDSRTETVVEAGLTQRVLIRLPRLVDVVGHVLDRNGQPVPGATIFAARDQPMTPGESIAQSGEDGRYSIRSIDRGFALFAKAPGKGASESVLLSNKLDDGSSSLSLDLRLDGSKTELFGKVFDTDWLPVPGARVGVWCIPSTSDGKFVEQTPFVVTTDANGEYRASGLSSSDVELVVDAPGHPLWDSTLPLPEGDQDPSVDIQLKRGVTITGKVSDENGRVAGAKIRQVLDSRWDRFFPICTVTKADGTFLLDAIAPWSISIVAEPDTKDCSYRPTVELQGKPGTRLECDFRLPAGATIRGRVEDEGGKPLVGWKVLGSPRTRSGTIPLAVQTDEAGRFELRGCVRSAHAVSAYAPREWDPRCRLEDVRPEGAECVIVVKDSSRPSAIATGRLLDADGSPAVGVSARIWMPGFLEHSGMGCTDAEGCFALSRMPPGKYVLVFSRIDGPVRYLGPVDLGADQKTDLGDVQIERPGRVELRLHRPDGVPFQTERGVRLFEEHGIEHPLETEDGVLFVCETLLPGKYRVEYGDEGVATVPISLVVRPAETTRLETNLPRGFLRQLWFRPPKDEILRRSIHAVIRGQGDFVLERDCWLMSPGHTPESGCYLTEFAYEWLAGFAPGHYTCEANSVDGYHASGGFDVGEAKQYAPPIEIELRHDP